MIKYRAGEQNVDFARAAVEALGGNGYVETFPTARLLRDAQVNTIWEGTSNICAPDLQRAIAKQQGHRAVLDHLASALDPASDGPTGHSPPGRARCSPRSTPRSRRSRTAAIAARSAGTAPRRPLRRRRRVRGDGRRGRLRSRPRRLRKTLVAELFAARRAAAADPVTLVTDGSVNVPELYPALFGEGPLTHADYRAASAAIQPEAHARALA